MIIFLYTCLQLWTDKVSDSSEGSSEVSIQTDLAHLALDIIGRCAFGFNFNTVLSGESEISRAFSVVIKGVNFGRLMKKRLIPFYNSLPLDDNIKEQKSFEKTDETVLKVNNTTVFFYHFNFTIIILVFPASSQLSHTENKMIGKRENSSTAHCILLSCVH